MALVPFASVQPAVAAIAETPGAASGEAVRAAALEAAPAGPAFAMPALGAGQALSTEQAAALVDGLIQFAAAHAGDEAALRAASEEMGFIEAEAGERMPAELASRLRTARVQADAALFAFKQGRGERVDAAARRALRTLGQQGEDAGRLAAAFPEASAEARRRGDAVQMALSKAWKEGAAASQAPPAADAPAMLPPASSPLKVSAFRRLLASHALMVFADNLFKSFLSLALLDLGGSKILIGLVGLTMLAPWVPLGPYVGSLVDRVSKSKVIKTINFLAIPVLAGTAVVLAVTPLAAALPVVYAAVALMGVHSVVHGTTRDSIVKEYVPSSLISNATGMISMVGSFVILAAFPAGGALLTFFPPFVALGAVAALAAAGFLVSLTLPRTEPAGGQPVSFAQSIFQLGKTVSELKRNSPDVLRVLLGVGYFAFLASLALTAVPNFGREVLPQLSALGLSLLQATAGVGIAVGAVSAGSLSNGRTVLGYITLGATGLTASAALLALGVSSVAGVTLALALMGFSAGFFSVPLTSYIVARSGGSETGKNLGLSGAIYGLAGAAGSGVFALIGIAGLPALTSFGILAFTTGLVAAYLLWKFPADAARGAAVLVTKLIYRVKVHGIEHVPAFGAAVAAGNHVTWMDAVWVNSVLPRNVRFLMNAALFKMLGGFVGRLARLVKIIPLSKETAVASLAQAQEEMKQGRMTGIFPEGQLTRLNMMLGFKQRGIETLNRDYPTQPFYIDGAWGSIFSFSGGRFFTKWIKSLPYRLSVWFGPQLPPGASAQDVRYAVMDLGEQAMRERLKAKPTLARAFLHQAKARWSRMALADKLDLPGGKVLATTLTYGRALVATIMLAQSLQPRLTEAKNVAVMIPPAVATGLANLALTSQGRVPVNLDFVADNKNADKLQASIASLRARLKKGEMDRIITTRTVIKKFYVVKEGKAPEGDEALKAILTGDPTQVVFIEDVLGEVKAQKLRGLRTLLAAYMLPTSIVEKLYFSKASTDLNDTATILFTTGSTGDPKGVELSHLNLSANVEAVSDVYDILPTDRVMNALPLFHAFGLMSGFWMPMLMGVGSVMNANPKEYTKIGDLIQEFKTTIFPTVPSWLADYIKNVPAEKLKTLRYTIGGGAKLWPEMAHAWQKHAGSPALEGYGATELAPVAALNVPDVAYGQIFQAGHKDGSVGRLLPGLTGRLVDPDNPDPTKPVAPGQPGVLLIKGPNVMKGYYKDEERTAEVLSKDGWYNTGDIFTMDPEGFLFFVERNDGVAKIKGEKAPRAVVEKALNDAVGIKDEDGVRKFIVVNVKDAKDGEKFIVLYKDVSQTPEQLRQAMSAAKVRDLFIPAANNFFQVEELPVIGALQKPNYKAARVIALERLKAEGRE